MIYQNNISHVIRKGDNLYQLSRYYHTTVPDILALNPCLTSYNLIPGTSITINPGQQFTMQSYFNPSFYFNSTEQITLINDMREVWIQHVYWTRMLLISIADRLNDQQYVTARLLENPADIANIFERYYPVETAGTVQQLLTEHLQIGASLITALRDEELAKAADLNRQWYVNADQMAEAFSSMNPYYNRDEVRMMLYKHLELTTDEVKNRLAGDYPADIESFDKVEAEVLEMADYFSQGLIIQFPQLL